MYGILESASSTFELDLDIDEPRFGYIAHNFMSVLFSDVLVPLVEFLVDVGLGIGDHNPSIAWLAELENYCQLALLLQRQLINLIQLCLVLQTTRQLFMQRQCYYICRRYQNCI